MPEQQPLFDMSKAVPIGGQQPGAPLFDMSQAIPLGQQQAAPTGQWDENDFRRARETFGQNFADKLHQMAGVAHDLAHAVETGDWKGLQEKYPPLEPGEVTAGGLWQTLKGAHPLNQIYERRETPTGEFDPWATAGATLSNLTMAAQPMIEGLRGINAEYAGMPKPVVAAAEEAAPKLTLAQRYPKAATRVAEAVGGGVGAAAGGAVEAATGGLLHGVPTVTGGIMGRQIASEWIKKYTTIPETPPQAQPLPSVSTASQQLADAIVNRFGNNIPESDAPIPASLYRQIQGANLSLTERQIRGLGEDMLRSQRQDIEAARVAAVARRPAARPAEAAPAPSPAAAPAAPPEAPGEAAPAPAAAEPLPGPDELYRQAVRATVDYGKASTSLLQRRLRIGYGQAANLIDQMEQEGIVGPAEGAKPRDVVSTPDWLRAEQAGAPEEAEEPAAAPATKPTWETQEQLSQRVFQIPFEKLVELHGSKQAAREALQPFYKTQERSWAQSQGVPTGTDAAALRAAGIDPTGMTYDQAVKAVQGLKAKPAEAAPATLADQLQQSLEQTPPEVRNAAATTAATAGIPETPPPPQTVTDALTGRLNTRFPNEQADAARVRLKQKMSSEGMGASAFGLGELAKAIWASPEIYEIAGNYAERLAKAGRATFQNFRNAMVTEYGNAIEPHLEDLWDRVSRQFDVLKAQPTRKPTGKNTVDAALAANEPLDSPLRTDRSTYERNDPAVLEDNADLLTRKRMAREPQRDDKFRGEPRFDSDEEFQDAHDKWEKNLTAYVGFKPTATDAGGIVDQFVNHLMDNKRAIWNMIPDHLREEWMNWYDTARNQALRIAGRDGLSNEQGAALVATQSPQKGWFENLSIADRISDIFKNQQDHVTDGKMLLAGAKITDSNAISQVMRSKLLTGRTLAELDSPEILEQMRNSKLPELRKMAESGNGINQLQGVWVRLYDQAHNESSFPETNAWGEDLGLSKNDDGSLAKLRWQSTDAVGKGVSVIKDGSLANIFEQLGDRHKVPNFNNNVIAPDHPGGFYTSDTHDVAAGLGRPLGSSAPEVNHNFGSDGARLHADTGLKGTYGLHAQSGIDLAQELGFLPRQVQSVVWEGIRKLFPDTFKRNEAAVGKIDGLWRQYETGDLTHDQVWQGIFKVRAEAGLDVKTGGIPKEFLETREQYNARRAAERSDRSLRGPEYELGQPEWRGEGPGARTPVAGLGNASIAAPPSP